MKFKSALALFSVFATCLYTGLSWAAADKLNTAYISTTPGSSSVLWVAKDARIFDKYGIDATMIFIAGSVRGIQSILAGEILIGEGGGPGLASARLAGGDVVAIAGNVNVLPYYLVAQPSIKKPEDLKGKIGGNHIAGTTAEFALKVELKKMGMKPLKDVNLRVAGLRRSARSSCPTSGAPRVHSVTNLLAAQPSHRLPCPASAV